MIHNFLPRLYWQCTNILTLIGLTNLKENLVSDLRYRSLQSQRAEFSQHAMGLATKLASALGPMFVKHNTEDPHIGMPNIGQSPDTWTRWNMKMCDMWLACLHFKAQLELDPEYFHYSWPQGGSDYDSNWMQCNDPRQIPEGEKIYFAFLPAIIAPDRNGLVLFKAIVVVQ